MKLIETTLGILYPHNCSLCAVPIPETRRGWICEACESGVKYIRPPFCKRCGAPFPGEITTEFECFHCAGIKLHFETAVCATRAEGIARECIHNLKYRRHVWLDQHLAQWLGDASEERVRWDDVGAIVPVPLFPRREREREFNQAQLIAEHLARRFQKRLISRSLRRVRDTRTQTRLDRGERERNVYGAFAVRDTDVIRGRGIALVDDVYTTGATTSECARVLKKAGAELVIALAVAHG